MDAIWERNAVGTPPTLPASPQTGFPSKSAPGGPTVPGDYWYHMMTQEIRNAIIGAGLDPDAGNLEQLSEALLAHYERAASYTPPGPNATTTTLQARVSERISLSRNLTVVEMLSIGAGLGQFDLTAKLQETLQYALDIGGCIVEAPAGVIKCNLLVPKGIILEGQGRGREANFFGAIPMTSNYAFVGGGTTLIPADRTKPVVKASGSGGASGWPTFTLRNLKISDNFGSIVAGTVGVLAELAANYLLDNVEIRNVETAAKFSTPGKTCWSWMLHHVTIADCVRGLDCSNGTASATPLTMFNVDIRRCTEWGAKFDKFTCLGWYGGTVADNQVGVIVHGDTNGQAAIAFHDLQWETNLTYDLDVGGAGTFPGGPVVVIGGQFADYRGSAGDGSVWPTVHAGKVAIRYNVNESTSRLIIRGTSFVTIETCIEYAGNGIVTRDGVRMYQCTKWGKVYAQGGDHDQEALEYSAARGNNFVGFGFGRMVYKTNDFSTYSNNFYFSPADENGSNVSGLLPNGAGAFSQWSLHAGSDPDNSSFVTMEAAATYGYLYTGKRGSAVAQKLIIQKPGGVVALYGGLGAGQLAGFGTPTNGAVIANFNASTATLQQTAQMVAAIAAHLKQRGDFAA